MFFWASVYGLCAGGAIPLVQAGAISMSNDTKDVGNRIGIVFGVAGTASLLGAPVGGQLVKLAEERVVGNGITFLPLQRCVGVLMLIG